MKQEVADLIAARDHIRSIAGENPSMESRIALQVIEERLKERAIFKWISKNREKLLLFIELEAEGYDAKQLLKRNKILNDEIRMFKESTKGKYSVKLNSAPATRLFSFIK